MILKGGLSVAQPGDHWLKKAMSLAWAKSSPALIYHSFLPHDTPPVPSPGNQHASLFWGKWGKESMKKEGYRDGCCRASDSWCHPPFPHPFPLLDLQILGLHRSIIHLICLCREGIRSAAHWLIWSISVDLGQLSDSRAWRYCTSVWQLKSFLFAAAAPVLLCSPTAGRLWRSRERLWVRLSHRLGNLRLLSPLMSVRHRGWVCWRVPGWVGGL